MTSLAARLSALRQRLHPQAVIGLTAAAALVASAAALAFGVATSGILAGEPGTGGPDVNAPGAAAFVPGANFNWYREQYGIPLPSEDGGAALWALLGELAQLSVRAWSDAAAPSFDSIALPPDRLVRLADPSSKSDWLLVRTRGALSAQPLLGDWISTERPVAADALPMWRVSVPGVPRDLVWWGVPSDVPLDGREADVLWQVVPGVSAALGGSPAAVPGGVVLAVRVAGTPPVYRFREASLSSLRLFPSSFLRIGAREARRRLSLVNPLDLELPVVGSGLPRGVAELESIVALCERALALIVPESDSLEYRVDPADIEQWRTSLAASMRRALDLLLGLPPETAPAVKRLQWHTSRRLLGE